MKRDYLLSGILSMCLLAGFNSCSGDDNLDDSMDNMVRIHLSKTQTAQTKGFLDDAAKTEDYEQSISQITVLVYEASGDGNLLLRHDATVAELTSSKMTFLLPRGMEGKTLSFVAVANMTLSTAPSTLSDAFELLEEDCTAYNGAFAEITATALKTGGFVMSSIATDVTVSAKGLTDVVMPLERTVAKVAIRTTISGDFAKKYSGSVKISNVSINNISSNTRIISPSLSGGMSYDDSSVSLSQVPGTSNTENRSLFYAFEKSDGKATIVMDGLYDADGDFSTTKDQTTVTYSFDMDAQLKRNSYFKLDVQIQGLEGSECNMTMTLKEWAGPYSQEVAIGH